MSSRSLSDLSDAEILRGIDLLDAKLRTAEALAALAEFDARKLYLAEGFPSMELYCIHVLREDEDELPIRLRVARLGREFPEIFAALADGRVQLETADVMKDDLTHQNVDELLAAATHKTKTEVIAYLQERAT